MAQTATADVTPNDFEPFAECDKPLTKSQVTAIRNMAYYRACLMRNQNSWSEKEEAAFINGVMCAFFATKSQMKIPAFWMMSPRGLLDLLAEWKAEGKLAEGG